MKSKETIKRLNIIATILSVIILSTVLMMRRVKIDVAYDLSFLPGFNALMNKGADISFVLAFYFIKKKNIEAHRKSIYTAFLFSSFFLLSYVMYHFTSEETTFCQEGTIKIVYFTFLISHVILAGISFPFILFTFVRGYTGQVEKHKKMARYVYPVWLYVAISGPICYLLLSPCYI